MSAHKNESTDWDALCESMEANSPALHEFLETWGKHCGASRKVFRGHLCKMIDACATEPRKGENE